MPRRLLQVCGIGILSAGLAAAGQTTIRTAPVTRISAASGQQMYASYCAVCHGTDGRGKGPAAPALSQPPTDLTQLARANGGSFPADHVKAVLQFGMEKPAHGSKAMPVWGPALRSLDAGHQQDSLQALRVANLTAYLRTLQQ